MDNKRYYDFGLKHGHTFIDGRTIRERNNYRKRHLGNETEKTLIENLVPSPSLFSFYLLWGPYDDINHNIDYLNNLWLKKHNN